MGNVPNPAMEIDLEPASPVLCVSFSALAPRHQPFVNRVLASLLVKEVRVFDADATWFHTGARGVAGSLDELAETLAGIARDSGAERVVTLGVASGAAPALLFAPLIGAQHAILFSPIATIDPARREALEDRRWAISLEAVAAHGGVDPRYADLSAALREQPGSGLTVEAHVGDEDELGLRHVELLEGAPGVTVVRHAEAGPSLANQLFDDGELGGLLARAMGVAAPVSTEPPAPPPFDDVDIVVLDPTGDGDVAATEASIAEHAAGARSVTVAAAEPTSFMASYHAAREAIGRGSARAVLILVAGTKLRPGVIDEMGATLDTARAVAAPVTHLRSADDWRTQPVPLGMAHLLHKPYTPMALMVDRETYDRIGGLDADLSEVALWDLAIRASAESTPPGPRTTATAVEATRSLVSAGLADRYRDWLRLHRADLPDEAIDQMAGDARREQQRVFNLIVERSRETYANNVTEIARLTEKARVNVIQSRKAMRRSPNRARNWRGEDAAGTNGAGSDAPPPPEPWFTFPAIDYLRQLDFSNCRVFEYGCGSSTAFWSAAAREVVAVEHDRGWYEQIVERNLPNVDIMLHGGRSYVGAIEDRGMFDVIVVDGRWRYDATTVALPHLTDDGLLILDNAERYPAITALLRDAGLLQVDLVGPGPQNRNAWCTSLFFRRSFAIPPRTPQQPGLAPGMREAFVPGDERWEAVNKPQLARQSGDG